jgi:hypothetical protein
LLEWEKFLEVLSEGGLWQCEPCYAEPSSDGYAWGIEIEIQGQATFKTGGHNAYPVNWQALYQCIASYFYPPKVSAQILSGLKKQESESRRSLNLMFDGVKKEREDRWKWLALPKVVEIVGRDDIKILVKSVRTGAIVSLPDDIFEINGINTVEQKCSVSNSLYEAWFGYDKDIGGLL